MGGMVLETSLPDIFIHSDAQFKLEKAEVSVGIVYVRAIHVLSAIICFFKRDECGQVVEEVSERVLNIHIYWIMASSCVRCIQQQASSVARLGGGVAVHGGDGHSLQLALLLTKRLGHPRVLLLLLQALLLVGCVSRAHW